MNSQWEQFLRGAGAQIVDGTVLDFGDAFQEKSASLERAAVVDLSDLAIIRARGADALSFLDGQLTNDLRPLDSHHHVLAAYCNPKGRAIALLRIWRDGEDLLLLLPASLAPGVLDRLRRYVLRAKVSLTHDESLSALGLVGPKAVEIVASFTHATAPVPGQLVNAGGIAFLAIAGVAPRYIVVGSSAARQEVWARCQTDAVPAGVRLWKWHDIQVGLPTVRPETTEAFVPQMLNLDTLGGISFNKGCYPGQEIVARMHYLGKLKQRLYRLSFPGHVIATPGTEIFAPHFGDQAAGTVVESVSIETTRTEFLAVVQIASAESDTLHLSGHHGPSLHVERWPNSDSPASP